MRAHRLACALAAGLLTSSLLAACGTAAAEPSIVTGSARVYAAASIDVWGSLLSQLGGTRVRATSLITSPATDPHDYEPTPADGRVIASARLFVENGVGYDAWAAKAIAADPEPGRVVLDVGHLVGVPEGGNPHRWYSPSDVTRVAAQITADLKRVDPADAAYFDGRHAALGGSLAAYRSRIARIRKDDAGMPVGASESIVAPLAAALGLDLVTPPSFLKAVSEGTDPSAADKAEIDRQIQTRAIAVYLVNSQNSTPDVSAQVAAARARGIPVVAVTETISPRGVTFQQWQTTQLDALARALATAAGRRS
jgi:zinc/manganese transport system substrate-binding protein